MRRVGGGFEYLRSERYTEAAAAVAAYDTYRALPPGGGPHTATDVAVLAEILRTAEAELDSGGDTAGQQQVRWQRIQWACPPHSLPGCDCWPAKHNLKGAALPKHAHCLPPPPSLQATLSQVLRAYQRVLAAAGLDPAADTRYYRTLLRLSLDPGEPCWWGRLFREIAANCRCGRMAGMQHCGEELGACLAAASWALCNPAYLHQRLQAVPSLHTCLSTLPTHHIPCPFIAGATARRRSSSRR